MLTPALRKLYGGELRFPPRPVPYVYANFVSTLDGVVSYGIPGQAGGGTISRNDAGDRLMMGLLRTLADAVIVGSATLREAGPNAVWDPAQYPAGDEFCRWRRLHRMPPVPLLVVVSASGRVPTHFAAFSRPQSRTLVITSRQGAARLLGRVPVRVLATRQGRVPVRPMLELLHKEFRVRRLLHEGGPSLLGAFVRAGALQELFLSLAPCLAGRDDQTERPGLIAHAAFSPAQAPQLRLLCAQARGSMLFLRYRVTGSGARFSSRRNATGLNGLQANT